VTSDQTATKDEHAKFAQVGSKYYPIFVAVFTALVIISNVTATKGVAFGPIITDGGFIVFPLTYVIGDVLSEVYGFKAARRAIVLGFAMNILAALTFWVTIYLPAADFYPNQEHFENIVHAYTQLIVRGWRASSSGRPSTPGSWCASRSAPRRSTCGHGWSARRLPANSATPWCSAASRRGQSALTPLLTLPRYTALGWVYKTGVEGSRCCQ